MRLQISGRENENISQHWSIKVSYLIREKSSTSTDSKKQSWLRIQTKRVNLHQIQSEVFFFRLVRFWTSKPFWFPADFENLNYVIARWKNKKWPKHSHSWLKTCQLYSLQLYRPMDFDSWDLCLHEIKFLFLFL